MLYQIEWCNLQFYIVLRECYHTCRISQFDGLLVPGILKKPKFSELELTNYYRKLFLKRGRISNICA
jgi:hypothetical protein